MRVPVTNAQAALLFLCGLLLTALIYELAAPLASLQPPQIRLHRKTAAIAEPQAFVAPSSVSFAAIDERPVFNPLRQPIAQTPLPGDTASATAPPVNVALIGIIVDGQNRLALIKMPGAAFASSVAVGGDIGGWQVSQITPDGIVLHSGASDYTIKLNGSGSGPAAATGSQPQQDRQE